MPTTMDHAMLAKIGHRELSAAKLPPKDLDAGLSLEGIAVLAKLFERIPAPEIQPQVPKPGASVTLAKKGGAMKNSTEHSLPAQPPNSRALPLQHPNIGAGESTLNCASCHATKDRHQGILGTSCVQCHATTQWTVAEFRHPSLRSTECAQCHKPPPSHNMMHFLMMSAPMARQPDAKVNQCYLCHQSTSWNDIKGLGWIKHH